MSKRLSETPAAIRARERRFDMKIKKMEREMYAEVGSLMDKGLSFDEAWVAAGGEIYTDDDLRRLGEARRRMPMRRER